MRDAAIIQHEAALLEKRLDAAMTALREISEVEFDLEFSFQRHCRVQQIARQALEIYRAVGDDRNNPEIGRPSYA